MIDIEPTTESRLPVFNSERCEVPECGATALWGCVCATCGRALCKRHAYPRQLAGKPVAYYCPDHRPEKGGGT